MECKSIEAAKTIPASFANRLHAQVLNAEVLSDALCDVEFVTIRAFVAPLVRILRGENPFHYRRLPNMLAVVFYQRLVFGWYRL